MNLKSNEAKPKKEGKEKNKNYFISKKIILFQILLMIILLSSIYIFLYLLNKKKTNSDIYYSKQEININIQRTVESWEGGYIIEKIKGSGRQKILGYNQGGCPSYSYSKITINGKSDVSISSDGYATLDQEINTIIIYYSNKISNAK